MQRKQHRWIKLIVSMTFMMVGVSFLVWLRLTGAAMMSVQTDSMAPALYKGDIVIAKTVDWKFLRVGDIIGYHNPDHHNVIITHRITRIDTIHHVVIAKGDNAPVADTPFDPSLVMGRVGYRLSKLGYVLDFFRSPAGVVSLVYIPAITIIWLELKRLTQAYHRPTYRLARN